ncbi:hypothetical protein [Actinomadura harenae]|uniref:Nuclear transport factor 2 family protein n=1 Tax=Actinomadura harenae TaxID=2483351 RepID=A0A3M2LYW4_9ACTN|nr:hypothetical protein [Actinomadura harenae]RMI40108.1 hypothetical protein EBO15_27490 [Actinomadura harenae]
MHSRSVRSSPAGIGHAVRKRAGRAPLAALLILTCASACGGSHANGGFNPDGKFGNANNAPPSGLPPSPTGPGLPSTMTPKQVDAAVIQAYRKFQQTYQQVYTNNDPSPLAQVAADPLLTKVTNDVEATKAKGEIWRFVNISNPRVYARSQDGAKVFVIDCMRTLVGYRYSAKTGKRLGGRTGSAYVYRTGLKYVDSVWKVYDSVQDNQC